MPAYLKHLKSVLKGLKYESLDHLVGRAIEIRSVETVEEDILSGLINDVPSESSLIKSSDPRFEDALERVMAKYGFIDATFSVSNNLLRNCSRANRKLLEELCFVYEKGSEEEFDSEDAAFAFAELTEDIEENKAYIKLFVEKEDRKKHSTYISEQYDKHIKLNETYIPEFPDLPKTFVITDACITNSDFVWINKHFYM